MAFRTSSRSSRLLIFINVNAFRIYFFRKPLDSIIYIECKWNLGRRKIFCFFLGEIVRNLQWRLGYCIWIKTGNCSKNSTRLGMSRRPLKNEIQLMESNFLINWLFRTWSFEAATYLHLILMKWDNIRWIKQAKRVPVQIFW